MQVLIQPESLTTGSTMPLSNGTDATAISVVAVPEPSTVGLLFGGAAGLFVFARRTRKRVLARAN
jgi:hypothetical protein